MQRPSATEHKPYFSRYIDLVPEGDYISLLNNNTATAVSFFEGIPVDKHNYAYAEGKWTVKEVLMHLIDTERVMSYRALAALRNDSASALPGFEENEYAANAAVSGRTMDDLLIEFKAVRMATTKLLEYATHEQSQRTAHVAGQPTTARALAYIIPGHVIHHINVTQERYL